MAYVYKHIRKDTNEVFYIGIGTRNDRMLSEYGRNQHWHRIVKKYGFIVEIIETDLDRKTACERETYWIKYYGRRDLNEGTLVNMTDGGDGLNNFTHSEETKEKMSKSKSGERHYNYGKSLKDSIKIKISSSHKGKTFSLITREKMSESKKGRKFSDETKKKMSESQMGRCVSEITRNKISNKLIGVPKSEIAKKNMSDAQKKIMSDDRRELLRAAHSHQCKIVLQFDLNDNFIKKWDSIRQANKYTNIRCDHISNCCKNKYGYKSAGGYKWKFEN
jgi:group I intron endonuclease